MRDHHRSRLMLTSERLRFETWAHDDQPLLFELHSDPRMHKSYGPDPNKWTSEAIALRFAGFVKEQESFGFTKWKLSLNDGTFIGRAGWSRWEGNKIEIGYAIEPRYWNNGYATEAAKALVTWGLARQPQDTLVGFALPDNTRSRDILVRIGMRFVDYRLIGRAEHAYYELGD